MRLELENIGIIQKADIQIDGLTVIAGENSTGKSTISKALYAMFDGGQNDEKTLAETRTNGILSIFRKSFLGLRDARFLASNIVKEKQITLESLKEMIQKMDSQHKMLFFVLDRDYWESIITKEMVKRINRFLEISDQKLRNALVERSLNDEFAGQVTNVFTEKEGRIRLTVASKTLEAICASNEVSCEGTFLSSDSKAVYLDSPSMLDGSNFNNREGHQSCLSKLLLKKSSADIVSEIINKESLQEIEENLNTVCSGNLNISRTMIPNYKENGKQLEFRNVSAGLKTFLVIKKLIQNNNLRYNGVLILDEPEIHLHPEWQILLAKIIVLLQKKFNLHILLSTHSPYFLEALEVYSNRYECTERCHYYLAENSDSGLAKVSEVTDNLEAIYKKLAKPFQTLEDERYL